MSSTTTGDRFTAGTREAIERAKASVLKYKHTHITPEHILLGIVDGGDPRVQKGLELANATPAQIRVLIEHHMRPGDLVLKEEQLGFSERAKRVIEAASEEAKTSQKEQIGPEHVLLGLVRVRNTVASAVLAAIDLHEDELRKANN